jgi:hypothetical protein
MRNGRTSREHSPAWTKSTATESEVLGCKRFPATMTVVPPLDAKEMRLPAIIVGARAPDLATGPPVCNETVILVTHFAPSVIFQSTHPVTPSFATAYSPEYKCFTRHKEGSFRSMLSSRHLAKLFLILYDHSVIIFVVRSAPRLTQHSPEHPGALALTLSSCPSQD